jgi:hypothetical protein
LSLLEVFSVFLISNHFLWVFVRDCSLLFSLLSHSLWSRGLLWRATLNVLAQSMFNHIFKVVFRRNYLNVRIHLFW